MRNIESTHGLGESLKLVWWLFRTKLIDKSVRLFRFPIAIRGKKYIDFGNRLTTGVGCRFDCFRSNSEKRKTLIFGSRVQLNDYVHIVAMESVVIGDDVLMASHVFISDNSHGSYKGDSYDTSPDISPIERQYRTSPITIGEKSWIGEGVIVMPGISIGKGCVIGAHSVVSKSIPDYSIAAGTPAKVIKKFNFKTGHWEVV